MRLLFQLNLNAGVRGGPWLLLLALLGWSRTLPAQTPPPPGSIEQRLRQYRGQKRLVLLLATAASQADFKVQKDLLTGQQNQLAAHDLLVLDLLYAQLPAADQQFLTRRLGGRLPAFMVVLVGKDGEVKRRSSRPISAADLFQTVDRMPMRRQEMRRRAVVP